MYVDPVSAFDLLSEDPTEVLIRAASEIVQRTEGCSAAVADGATLIVAAGIAILHVRRMTAYGSPLPRLADLSAWIRTPGLRDRLDAAYRAAEASYEDARSCGECPNAIDEAISYLVAWCALPEFSDAVDKAVAYAVAAADVRAE